MAMFRLLLDSKAGDHISNALPPVEAAVAKMRIHRIVGRPPELIPDTKTLRRELEAVDACAQQLQAQPKPPEMFLPIAIAWNRPVEVAACGCAKCEAEREAAAKIAKLEAAEEEEHPEFAFPKVDHCGLLVEEDEEEKSEARMTNDEGEPAATIKPRKSLAEQRREAWRMFGSSCRRWSWRWPLIMPPTLVLLMLASCLSLALEAFAWFVAKEPSL